MKTAKTIKTDLKTFNASLDENSNRRQNDKTPSSGSGVYVKYVFPCYGGIFSEAARRKKAVHRGEPLRSIIG